MHEECPWENIERLRSQKDLQRFIQYNNDLRGMNSISIDYCRKFNLTTC